MRDMRYLKKQGHAWYFHMTVPKELRHAFPSEGRRGPGGRRLPGKPREKIVIALGTDSLNEARDRRWPLIHEWREKFKRAKANVPLTKVEIEDHAREYYRDLLAWLERQQTGDRQQQIEDISAKLGVVEELLDAENWDEAAKLIQRVERKTGVALDRGSPTYGLLARALLTAEVEAYAGRLRLLRGEPSEEPKTFLGADGIDPVTLRPIASLPRPVTRIRSADGGMTFEEAATQYMYELKHDPNARVTEQTFRRTERVFALFKDYSANAPLAAIDKDTARDFVTKIASLDPDWGNKKGADRLPFEELVEKFGKGERHLSNAAVNKYVHSLSALFKWAQRKTNFDGRNPFEGQSRPKPDPKQAGWRAYSVEDLNRLFAKRPARDEMYWIPLVALFSGMRLGEICQFRADDVTRKDGIWCFRVSAAGDGQHIKTHAAERFVPVHSELERVGFLEYARKQTGQLWPGLTRGGPDQKLGWNFSAQFTEHRRACGVTGPRLVFHSFRKNAAQALKDARATPAEIAELIGHERGFTVETYAPLGLPTSELGELVERIRYPGLRLSPLS